MSDRIDYELMIEQQASRIQSLKKEIGELQAELDKLKEINSIYEKGLHHLKGNYSIVRDERDALQAELKQVKGQRDKYRQFILDKGEQSYEVTQDDAIRIIKEVEGKQ